MAGLKLKLNGDNGSWPLSSRKQAQDTSLEMVNVADEAPIGMELGSVAGYVLRMAIKPTLTVLRPRGEMYGWDDIGDKIAGRASAENG